MKSPIILVNKLNRIDASNKGFLIPEIMLAFSLMTLFLTSAMILSSTMKGLRNKATGILERVEFVSNNISSTTLQSLTSFGNDSYKIEMDPLTMINSDYESALGKDNCNARININFTDANKLNLYSHGVDLGIGNASTDIEVRNGFAYLAADSVSASLPDLFIIDMTNPTFPLILSSLNTGPGLSAIAVAGHYIFAANNGTTNQLQIIDIANRSSPILLSTLKLPLPNASSTAPAASSIFYDKGRIFLGTQKWNGNEFSVIDVENPYSPKYLGGYETDTLINDIYVKNNLAYIAASDSEQMEILDIHDSANIKMIQSFAPSGWETQVGEDVSYFEGRIALGRTTGGFNVLTNHEVFTFSTSSPTSLENSRDIPGGVYGILMRPGYVFLSTHSSGHEFQIWKNDFSGLIMDKSLVFMPKAMSCDNRNFYFATGDKKGIAMLIYEK